MARALSGQDRPKTREILSRIDLDCRRRGLRTPSRATIYKLIDTLPCRTYPVGDLPPSVRDALYNVDPAGEIPGHQLAFHCFNYGDLRAMSFAAGLPWLALHQALRMRGYRLKSRGPLEAVALARGI